jgi:hypothetical protein
MDKYVLVGITQPATFEIEQGFNTIGRNATNDFRVHDATVSSFHCEIVVSGNAVTVHDLGSTNGTFIEGARIEEGKLATGQTLKLGSVELRLEARPAPEPVEIAIPTLSVEEVPRLTFMPDGLPACLNHPDRHATQKCHKCQKHYCAECVHVLGLSGGKSRVFCPSCSEACVPLPVPKGAAVEPKKRPSLLGRLTQTIRMRFK